MRLVKIAFRLNVLWLLLYGFYCHAQAPEQDCFNAIYVCSSTYNQPNAYNGVGSVSELPLGVGCLTSESNSVWYRFTAISDGSLTLQIDPNNPNDDYDFALYDLTTSACSEITDGTNLPVRCNYSSDVGSTGLSNAGTNTAEPSNGSNQCTPLDVQAGETYVLLVNNFTNSPNGYNLNFGGTASIADEGLPTIDLITFMGGACNPNRINLTFNENVQCSSIASDLSDFVVSGPENLVITQALGLDCGGSSLTDQIRLRFSTYIMTPGVYTLTIVTGSDGNTLMDLCGNEIPPGTTYTFEVENVGPTVTIPDYTDSDCQVDNGTATAQVTNGTSPYAYNWNTSPSQTTQTATGLGFGVYQVTVTDANGCSARAVVRIGNVDAPNVSFSNITDVSCNGGGNGEVTAVATLGVSPYSFMWNTNQGNATATGLSAGSYTVTITDANGCQASDDIDIDEPAPISGSLSIVSANCGVPDGAATINASGGTAPYTYEWSTNPSQTGSSINNVYAGIYEVTITDANSCTATETAAIVSVTAPNAFIESTVPSCGGPTASVTVAVNGGNGPHTFEWSTNPVQTTPTAINLYPGSYYVQVVDVNNCVQILNVKIDSIPPPEISIDSIVQPDCGMSNGEIQVSASMGEGPYNYEWSTFDLTPNVQELPEGNYQVIVVDNIGCSDTLDILLEQMPPETEVTYTSACEGLPVSFSFTTNANPGSWLWDFGDGTTSAAAEPAHTFDGGGNFPITLYLLGGCEDDTTSQVVEIYPNPQASFITDPEVIGTRTMVDFIYTGDPATIFWWDFGNGDTSGINGPQMIFRDSGEYVITLGVVDANGCSDTTEQVINVINEPSIYLPNAFVPEGFSQSYVIKGTGVTDLEFKVFSRWGNVVYESSDINELMNIGWNGKFEGELVPQGIYGYMVNSSFVNGKQFSRTGTIIVLR